MAINSAIITSVYIIKFRKKVRFLKKYVISIVLSTHKKC